MPSGAEDCEFLSGFRSTSSGGACGDKTCGFYELGVEQTVEPKHDLEDKICPCISFGYWAVQS